MSGDRIRKAGNLPKKLDPKAFCDRAKILVMVLKSFADGDDVTKRSKEHKDRKKDHDWRDVMMHCFEAAEIMRNVKTNRGDRNQNR